MPQDAYHHGNLRQALLDAGERLLETQGETGLSLRGLARAAGVSHTAPYRHFPSKSELLAALAARGFTRLEGEMRRIEREIPDALERRFLEACRAYVRLGITRPAMYRLMFGQCAPAGQSSAELSQAGQAAFATLVEALAQGQAAGIFREGSTLEMAVAVWGLVHGLTDLAIAGRLPPGNGGDRGGFAFSEAACSLLVAGLLAPGRRS